MRFFPAATVLVVAGLLGWYGFFASSPVKLGLDLAGGTELIYRADTSNVAGDTQSALNALREVIDRRVNLFGVAEPLVQLERSSAVAGAVEDRLLVELPGVTDVQAAVDAIGKTPTLDFRIASGEVASGTPVFVPTELTGRYLKKADLQFGSQSGQGLSEPIVVLTFTDEGSALFERITRENIGNTLAIYLDGEPISTPVIREAISGGTATISGGFTPDEARELVRNLNFGALPVPIELVGSGTVGPTLGKVSLEKSLFAGLVGFGLVLLFMILYYRLPGLLAGIALFLYAFVVLGIFKLVPVTLTLAGIAGFILSLGMAVDANVLIFERIKEELRGGHTFSRAIPLGFERAWTSIRDSNVTTLITCAVLYWFGTSVVRGFAVTLTIGVLVSMFSAITVTRILVRFVEPWIKEGTTLVLGSKKTPIKINFKIRY